MNYEISYHEKVAKEDIPKLSQKWKDKVKQAIEQKLTIRPEHFGKPLRRSLKGYRKLRVGDYRVIFRIENNIVKIFGIQHRSIVYQQIKTRIF